ncbi:putative HD superfamily hydrolase of NAD metabolism [Caldanaerobius fijiensis DSM 17918]|uniref:bis(5'-nucleosyl)-tetraphosphatase (symmetrical) n=1 Tax=Caldanaerobius fijiensis DSM 17918 TaxID=1121256 RepID=A0A1M4WJ55_9THEO|nr:bis(5'-nucleosyl)-tetraphosphatase (symmetrical) YqeK [Caldanaerobius fijiensis]SHE81331.1 putative HD superfamily hydrolase of NAD metabolism [Caldanaerobius fijiensis DSM 17918]
MLSEQEISQRLEHMLTPKRYRHSLGVQATAVELASLYGADVYKASIAGLIHDCAKDLDADQIHALIKKYGLALDDIYLNQLELVHAPLGAALAKDLFDVQDEDILNAVRYHTTGRVDMNLLEKIIYLSDYIEPGRNFDGVNEIRQEAKQDLDKAVIMAMDSTIIYVIKKKGLIHTNTIDARNKLLCKIRERRG